MKNMIISIYFILVVLAIILTTLMSAFEDLYDNRTVMTIGVLSVLGVLFWLTHKNSKYFEYDSDGDEIIIMNRGLLLSEHLNYREHKIEIDKSQLISYNFKNLFFYKSVTVNYLLKNGKEQSDTFNITLLNRKKRRYIRQSLSKTIKLNKRNVS